MRLVDLQTQFQSYLLGGQSEIERHVVATDKVSVMTTGCGHSKC